MQDEKVYFDATRGPDESLEGHVRRPVIGPALVETARELATHAHGAQKDKAGNPYIDHPRRVAERLETAGASAQAVAAGWLHDVLEDTPTTAVDLAAVGIPTEVIDAVIAVTKRPGEPTEDYAARIRASALGLQVKEADLADNCDPARMALLDETTPGASDLQVPSDARIAPPGIRPTNVVRTPARGRRPRGTVDHRPPHSPPAQSRFAGPITGLLALFTFACAVRPANFSKPSTTGLRPANQT